MYYREEALHCRPLSATSYSYILIFPEKGARHAGHWIDKEAGYYIEED